MKSSMKLIILQLLAVSQIQAQYCNDESANLIVSTCLEVTAQHRQDACFYEGVMSHPEAFKQCGCYFDVKVGECYKNCPEDAGVQALIVQNQEIAAASCAEVKLNPNALPQPPPWQKYFPTSSISPKPIATTTQGPAATPEVKLQEVQNNRAYSLFMGSAFLGLFFMIAL